MRRMKDMAAMQPGMAFYGELPDSYSLIVNTENPVIKKITADADNALAAKVTPLDETIKADNDKIKAMRDGAKDGKLSDEEQGQVTNLEQNVEHARNEQTKIIREYGAGQPLVKQVLDLALLANGLLKGEALSNFISRSVELLKK